MLFNKYQKFTVIIFFIASLLIDLIWCIVIAWKIWFSPSYEALVPWEHGLHVTTVVIVGINVVLKVV